MHGTMGFLTEREKEIPRFYDRVEYLTSSVPVGGIFGIRGNTTAGLAAIELCVGVVESLLPTSRSAELC